MGSITEVWKNGLEWQKFIDYLDKQPPEGVDSSGVPLKLSRYAKFLSLYVNLHYKEIQLKSSETRVSNDIRFTLVLSHLLFLLFVFITYYHFLAFIFSNIIASEIKRGKREQN